MAEKKLKAKVLTWRASIAESELPRTTRAVAWALANYMNERGESAFPGVPRLCRDVGNERGDKPASKSTVIDALRRLQEAGYLVRVAQGGGRSKRGEWHAQLPERVQQLHRIEAEAGSRPSSPADAVSGAAGASGEVSASSADDGERVQPLHSLSAAERVQSQRETVQLAAANGAATAPEVEVLELDQEMAAAARAREGEAAALEVEERLRRFRIVGELHAAAIAEPERALAWFRLTDVEAERNPAGFFRSGFLTGTWPSDRLEGARPAPPLRAKKASIANHVEAGFDPDEIRHFIDVEWDTLAPEERAELHEHLNEILSGQEPAVPKPDLRAVDAA